MFYRNASVCLALVACVLMAACRDGAPARALSAVPRTVATAPNLKVAFIGDTGYGPEFDAVLGLIKAEGADLVLHQGDFDYANDADGLFARIDAALGPGYPYLAVLGNHDVDSWAAGCRDSDGCYADLLAARMARLGITPDHPDLNDQMYTVSFRGLKIVFVGQQPGLGDTVYTPYIRSQLAQDPHIWRVCSWHKNQRAMQVGSKSDEMGWGVYEACRNNAAIIATGHEHSYERTRTLLSLQHLMVDTAQHPPVGGVPGNPDQLLVGPGRTFAFVSGVGGRGMRNQDRCLPATYPYGGGRGCNYAWAKIHTTNQTDGVEQYGALFIEFNPGGDPAKAHGYFKTTEGALIDEFEITAAGVG